MGLLNFNKTLGRRGEHLAAKFLKQCGHRILARNVETPFGEIDLVAREKRSGRIIFVEVKTRSGEEIARAEQAVGRRKQRHIVRAAQAWLKSKGIADPPMRFDVLAVTFDAAGDPRIRHTPGAFRP
ncbi:MAG: YraN family protein [Anaerolineaceae bacterium]|nr:YraN family protein [Anaerolineaceae bacterium]